MTKQIELGDSFTLANASLPLNRMGYVAMQLAGPSNSPWIRGAPQSGFSKLMVRISARTSLGTAGRPGLPCRTFQAQNRRKLLRCQASTVSGLTMTGADRQLFQSWESHAQRSRSGGVSFGRFTESCRRPSWCRSARFSRWSAARDLKVADAAAANM